MNAISTSRILIIFLLIFIISCNGEKEETSNASSTPRIRKYSKLELPKINANYVLGDTVNFEISSARAIDSILFDYNDIITTYTDSSFSWIASSAKTGFQKIRLTVYSGGENETHYPRIKFLSDVVPQELSYEVITEYPHDNDAYTQGLFFIGDTLVESTGREGQSKLSKINLQTGSTYQTIALDSEYFGEGSTIWNNQIIQLTWTAQIGFVYNRKLEQQKTFHYTHEGWGITTLGDTLVVSDGTEILHLLDPRDFSELGKLEVYTHEQKVLNLNELEIIEGKIYANVWMKDLIVVIDPKSGKVLQEIDMRALKRRFNDRNAETFNGIAYKTDSRQIFVTGKLWPKLFEVKFISK